MAYYRPHGVRERRFRPLVHYLATLPPEQDTLQLTLAELVAILGPATSGLPVNMPNWNAADLTRVFQHRAGFTATLDRADRAITFTRQAVGSRPLQEA